MCGFSPALRAGRRRTGKVSRSITSSSRSLVVATTSMPWYRGGGAWRLQKQPLGLPQFQLGANGGVDTGAAASACRACLNSAASAFIWVCDALGSTPAASKSTAWPCAATACAGARPCPPAWRWGAGQFLQRFGCRLGRRHHAVGLLGHGGGRGLGRRSRRQGVEHGVLLLHLFKLAAQICGPGARRGALAVGSAGLCLLAHLGQHIQRRQGITCRCCWQ